MSFSEKQLSYFSLANHRWNIKSGATRSGKTYMDYFVIPKRIRSMKGLDGLIVLLGNTRGSLSRNIIEPMQRLWGSYLVSDIRTNNTATLFGETVYCLGADTINQVDKIRGASIKYCYGDEVATWSPDVFNMLKSRLDKEYSLFDGTCNPDSPNHWFKKFIDSDADIFYQQYTIDDNPYLPEAVRENIKREYLGSVFYDRYILGKWAASEGLVYPNFSPQKHIFDTFPEDGEYYISIDYGTLNPCSMGLWCVDNRNKTAYRIKEYYHSGRNGKILTDEEYYEALLKLSEGYLIQSVVIDPSAASFIACIKKHGFFSVKKASNSVLDGIRYTSSLLSGGNIKIHRSCEGIINEFLSYRWDSSASSDSVIKENDHALDDLRYFSYSVLRRLGW